MPVTFFLAPEKNGEEVAGWPSFRCVDPILTIKAKNYFPGYHGFGDSSLLWKLLGF